MISSDSKIRFIKCVESEVSPLNNDTKYQISNGYIYICTDTNNIYYDENNERKAILSNTIADILSQINNNNTNLSDRLNMEIQNRTDVDANLSGKLDTEEQSRINKDNELSNRIDGLEGYTSEVSTQSGSYGPNENITGNNGTVVNIPYITIDAHGRVTSIENKTLTCVNTDTSSTYIHPSYPSYSTGLYKISTSNGHIDSVSYVTKDDITALGIPGEQGSGGGGGVTYREATRTSSGLMSYQDKAMLLDTFYLISESSEIISETIGSSDYVIGGWRIRTDLGKFWAGNASVSQGATMQSPDSTYNTRWVFAAGSPSHGSSGNSTYKGDGTGYSNANFRTDYNGVTYITDLHASNSSSSDKKLKDFIEYLEDEDKLEEFFNNLKPLMFTYKNGKAKRHHMGFYAQDVAENAKNTIGDIAACKANVIKETDEYVDCNAVEEYFDPSVKDEDLNWYLDYSEFIAPTVAIVQKQQNRIKQLESEIEELKSIINQLQGLL